MSTNPEDIELTDEQKKLLAALSEQTGKPWDELLHDAVTAIGKQTQADNRNAKKPVRGWAKGSVTVAPDFDAPLEDFKDYVE